MSNSRTKFVFAAAALLTFGSLSFAQTHKTVHLEREKSHLDIYIDIPASATVQTFSLGFFHHVDVVSVHLDAESDLGDIYIEEVEHDISFLKEHRKHGLEQNFVKYHREGENDLIVEYKDPLTQKTYYEFHYIREIDGKKYYACSDGNKQYTLDEVLGMHKIAETLRSKK